MTEQATGFVQEGVDRFNEARERIDEELRRLQKELQGRRKRLERQFNSSRKSFEKQTRRQVKQLRNELRRKPLVKRAERLRAEASKQIEGTIEAVLDRLQIASKQDLKRIDRKIARLNKKLNEVEQARKGNGQQAPAQL